MPATKVANELAESQQKMVRARVVTVVVIAIVVVAIIAALPRSASPYLHRTGCTQQPAQ